MQPVRRYAWNTPEYADAFITLLRASGERGGVHRILRELLARYPAAGRAVDWGAGSGDLTALLLERFREVYAVEPSADMRTVLAARCPGARILDGTIMSTTLPAAVDVGVISHVFYHIPDHKWGAHVIRAADTLSRDGTLLVILKGIEDGSNRMLEHFGAPRFDLYSSLSGVLRRHREFDFAFSRNSTAVRTTSLADTLKIARFVLCDRDADAFARAPTEEDFQEYVRHNLWDEKTGTGGWMADVVFCFVRRNHLQGGLAL